VNPAAADPHRQHYGLTLGVLILAALAYALSQTMVVPALPAIQKDLHVSSTLATFVFTSFLLTASVATPVIGRLGDMFGKERMLTVTLGLFGVGSLLAATTHSIALLILARAIQGVAGAVFPLAFGIIRDEFPAERVGAGIGLISSTFGVGGGVGLVLSGVIVDNVAYEWIFWSGLIITAIALVATWLWVPESPIKSPAKIDWAGAGLLAAGLVALLVGVSEGNDWGWASPGTLGLFVAAAAILAFWVRFERGVEEPLVDMGMMRERTVLTTNITGFLVGFGMFGSFILIPQFVQEPVSTGYGFGASVTEAGVFLLPSAAVMLFSGPIAGLMSERLGSRLPLIIGTLTAAACFGFLAFVHGSHLDIYFASGLLGLGIGLSLASMANLVVGAVDQRQTGVATGINTIMRTIGGSLGGQVAASIVAASVLSSGRPAESGFQIAFAMSSIGLIVAFVAALFVPTRARRRASAAVDAEPARA
jgi:EmrB/QacA subfamily drug resistance transporter